MRLATISAIVRLFERGNVCVTGLRGRGKDLLMGNVIARRNKPYVSNLDYTANDNFIPLDISDIDCGENTYRQLLEGNVTYYSCPYDYGTDVYLSDAGIYFPSQYCGELNKYFPYMPVYQALSRQINRANFHVNTQNLGRVWDKIREQSDTYLTANWCYYFKPFNLVFQIVTRYDKASSCQDRVHPCRIRPSGFNREARVQAEIYRDKFFNTYGDVQRYFLIYRNRSKHDTYYFEKLFQGGSR